MFRSSQKWLIGNSTGNPRNDWWLKQPGGGTRTAYRARESRQLETRQSDNAHVSLLQRNATPLQMYNIQRYSYMNKYVNYMMYVYKFYRDIDIVAITK